MFEHLTDVFFQMFHFFMSKSNDFFKILLEHLPIYLLQIISFLFQRGYVY